jgi:membrane-bound metal-dependent hydrolase YbcI (DUF457 family)
MFIGHYAVGFAAKKASPGISLGWLFLAVQFLDLIWPTLLLLNIEKVDINHDPNQLTPLIFTSYPISHSLLMVIGWSILFGFIYWLIKKNIRYAVVLGMCVLSHWILDFIVHYPDLPLYPGNSPKVGLSLWGFPVIESIIELLMFITGVTIYLRITAAKNKIGTYVLWTLIVLLVGAFVANIFGPSPTDVKSVAWGAQLLWIFVGLAFWTDYNRTPINLDAVI